MTENEALKRAERKFEAVQHILTAAQSQINDAIREMSLAMVAMHDAVETGSVVSVQGEPDWEYGCRPLFMASVAAYPGERAKEVRATKRTPESWLPEMGEIYRRTKEIPAGPWVPVVDLPEGGASDAEG